jgi:long-chain acyl-CoA synthetase
VLVKALYDGSNTCFIETQVKFEDGRTGTISADLKINDAKMIQPTEDLAA